ncbi:hypothetical protein SSX86_025486 [Deinandra increscens subsp. villosa]|uniref:Cycloidea-like protein n=1 Tax=Deinandra increscens subsp. villosa TaxID=3103831 RepID=A0AAP0CGB1_9ASTR
MHPSYLNNNGNTSVSTINQQKTTSFFYYNQQDPNFKPTIMQSDGLDRFNNHMILENNCPTGKRSSKKDRHSKINTARGPRDRRMRLSLDVAKKFFRLQDMLGFDKASNTIEWLLMKSKPAIRDLMGVVNSPSSASECEVVSGIDGEDKVMMMKDEEKTNFKEKKKVQSRGVRKSVYIDQSLVKETREKARERARKRASEKRSIKLDGYDAAAGCSSHQDSKLRPSLDQVIDQNTNRLGSWIPFGENQAHSLTDQAEYPSSHFQFRQGIGGYNSSVLSSNWSPSFLFSYQHNPGLSHEHQLSDFQNLGKPWEGINN